MTYFIPIILGTGRIGARSEKVSEFVFYEIKNYGFDSELIKPRDWLDSPFTGEMKEEKHRKLSEIFTKAHGFIIVSPEYNHSFPGELKLLLDNFYEEYKNKPVGICGVSAGSLGGARAVEQLRLICIEFSMIPIRNSVYFSEVGKFEENKDSYKEFLKIMFSELKYYLEKLNRN